MFTLNKVRKTIEKYNMFNYGDTVVIGVSGGADSVMLLDCLCKLRKEYGLTVKVAHINHKMRPGDAENDAAFVKSLCDKLGAEFHLKEEDVRGKAKEWGVGEEVAGRKIRYDFFYEVAGKDGKIATAHNANDNVETCIMRFMRGAGVKGLSGIGFSNGQIVRPILTVSRKEIENYLVDNGLTHITDSTNLEFTYTRNKIRMGLLPYIKEQFNPNIIETVTENMTSYREDSEYFDSVVKNLMDRFGTVSGDKVTFSLDEMKKSHPSIGKRVLIHCIKTLMGTEDTGVGPKQIDSIFNGRFNNSGTFFTLNNGYQVRIGYDVLIFEKVEEEVALDSVYTVILNDAVDSEGVEVACPKFNFGLEISVVENSMIDNKPNCFYIPYEFAKDLTLQIRTSRDGDVFRNCDSCHKKLNRFLSDKKMDSYERKKAVLICNGSEVFCVVGKFVTRFEQRSGKFVKIVVKD